MQPEYVYTFFIVTIVLLLAITFILLQIREKLKQIITHTYQSRVASDAISKNFQDLKDKFAP